MVSADPPWLPGCKANIAKIPGGKLCSENHCLDSQNYYHAVCYCQAPYENGCSPNRTPNCCSYTATSPVIVFLDDGSNCYCCCGCFSVDTEVNFTAGEAKPIIDFQPGQPVWVAMDIDLRTWASIPVQFSSGTGADGQNTMIRVSFGDDERVYATRNQLFMVADHRLKRASYLVPGQDQLVRADGSLTPVHDLSIGTYKAGVHHISTGDAATTDPNGHLLIANGVVVGDYSLQTADLELVNPDVLVEGHASLPEFGTKEYLERYTHLLGSSYQVHPADRAMRQVEDGVFEEFTVTDGVVVPSDARTLFTTRQARDIRNNAAQAPISSGAGKDITYYLFKLFKGFYPTVVFYLDELNEVPNIAAFRQYGVPIVVVNGGFIRTDIVQFEALAFGIAQALASLFGGKPQNSDGYTCTGAADYAALLAIFPNVWFGWYARPYLDQAIIQLNRLFDKINRRNRNGTPGDTCVDISIDCRKAAMAAAARTALLPECAGGPKTPTLIVTGAKGGQDTEGTYVLITFNEAVDVITAERPGSYEFTPVAPAISATMAGDQRTVRLRADLKTGREYTVRAVEVLSANGNPTIPSKSRATFTIAQPATVR